MGFNPFDAIGDVAKQAADAAAGAAKQAADAAADVAKTVVDGAGAAVAGAGDIAGAAVQTAGAAAGAVVDGAGSFAGGVAAGAGEVAGVVADTAAAAKNSVDERIAKAHLAEVEEWRPEVEAALSKIEGAYATTVLRELGESPLGMTRNQEDQIKGVFPVPREQRVLWADAEFDLRPSGIIATDVGVFIRSDSNALPEWLPNVEEGSSKSTLFYFRWEDFEPSWFIGSDDNIALTVDPECSARFVDACKRLAEEQRAIDERLELDSIDIGESQELQGITTSIEASTAAMAAENAVFAEQKAFVNNPAGHGEMAEEAITKIDNALGHDARVLGRDNAKNGADRLVNGTFIQTKYYKSARGSLEACFDAHTGEYRYMLSGGKPMQLEVPKDQYQQVLEGFKKKIADGKVPGVTNPDDATKYVRKGRLTYKQAVNLTKPGTIESLAYDAATGVVTCSCAFGVSFLATTFLAYRNSGDMDQSVQAGIRAGVQVFGVSFVQHVAVAQIARTSAANMLMKPSQYVVSKLGSKASQTIVNGLRTLSGKGNISGAAASKQLAKMLRSTVLTTTISLAVSSAPEMYKLASGRVSQAQFAKNLAGIVGSTAGGLGGTAAAGIAAAKVAGIAGTGVAPGVGTVVGIAGGFVGGAVASAAVSTVGDIVCEDDNEAISRFFNAMVSCMASEYMLSGEEVDALVERIDEVGPDVFSRLFEDVFASDNQEETVRAFLAPHFDSVVQERKVLSELSEDMVLVALMELLRDSVGTASMEDDGGAQLPIDAQFETIGKLKKLLDAGALTQEEFDAKKREVMDL